jgi:hypothetical protein
MRINGTCELVRRFCRNRRETVIRWVLMVSGLGKSGDYLRAFRTVLGGAESSVAGEQFHRQWPVLGDSRDTKKRRCTLARGGAAQTRCGQCRRRREESGRAKASRSGRAPHLTGPVSFWCSCVFSLTLLNA